MLIIVWDRATERMLNLLTEDQEIMVNTHQMVTNTEVKDTARMMVIAVADIMQNADFTALIAMVPQE
jgi:hypothetical protein